MIYAVNEHKPGFLLVGGYGTGKTLLSRSLIKTCPPQQHIFAFISNPRLSPLEILSEIYWQLLGRSGEPAFTSKSELLHKLTLQLEDNINRGFYSVVIVDEAQSIHDESILEELRLLLNIQGSAGTLFTLMLIGQPGLLETMAAMPQFHQRLSVRFHLRPLSREETRNYITHRLEQAGLARQIFSPESQDRVYELSGGNPRAINNICDLALLTGFISHSQQISRDIVIQAAKDLEEDFSIPGSLEDNS